jgi:NAD(P)-dependent dehydrogenase (short-subunit alcohol dehydrogenase family)
MDRLKDKIALISGGARGMGAAVHLDVRRAAHWRTTVEVCEREFGGLDILINNAGIARLGGIEARLKKIGTQSWI